VMELVRGETLEERLKRDGRLPGRIVERMFERLLDGLEQVHHAGFLHRDIKPANIILDAQNEPTLIDFGAARISLAGRTAAMTAIYTPRYAAVEQEDIAGKLGPWTDIYCLSATLYHAITGQSPPRAITRALNDGYKPLVECAPAGFARRVLAAIDWGLALRPDDRPQSIASWRHALTGAEAFHDRAAADDDGNATIVGPQRRPQAASKPLTGAGASASVSAPPVVPPTPPSSAPTPALAPPPGATASRPAARRRNVLFAAIALALILVPANAYWAFRSGLLPEAVMRPKPEQEAKPKTEAAKAETEARQKAETEASREAEAKRKAREEGDPEAAAAATQRAEDEAGRKVGTPAKRPPRRQRPRRPAMATRPVHPRISMQSRRAAR